MTAKTQAHTHTRFANPFLVCEKCRADVEAWHDPSRCGCGQPGFENLPCGHQAGITSLCPSWSPVSGCRCKEALGRVDHPQRKQKIKTPS